MMILSSQQVVELAPLGPLVDALSDAFRSGCVTPPRQVSATPGGAGDRLFLSMPAFGCDGTAIVKVVTVRPDNRARGLETIQGTIVAFSATGAPVAIIDGTTLTRLRTAAVSALASRYLSRTDSTHLLLVGTGALAPVLAAAHCIVRPIQRISVWGRELERARKTAVETRALVPAAVEVSACQSIEGASALADIVSCATSAREPVICGRWLRTGTFVDLVGSFSPDKREADDDTVRRARLFVDTFEGAMSEAGDLLDPLQRGVIARAAIEGELSDLASGRCAGRRTADEITLFKSVGTALADFAAARLVLDAARAGKQAGRVDGC